MESSDGLEQDAFLALWQAGRPCALTNPRAVRRFVEAMGRLEKTDRIDAEVIALFAAARRIKPTRHLANSNKGFARLLPGRGR